MKKYTLPVWIRVKGKASKPARLRREGSIPAVLYGKEVESCSLAVRKEDFTSFMRDSQGAGAILTLEGQEVDKQDVIVQAVARHPLTDEFEHIDFLALVEGRVIHASVQVHTKGEAIGVKQKGGILEHTTHEVAVACLPKYLPQSIEVDITDLDVGQAVHIRDLPVPEGVSYTGQADIVVVACTEPAGEVAATQKEATESQEAAEKPEA